MEKFIDKSYQPKVSEEIKRADNVKIVQIAGQGVVYVCPFPDSHYDDLKQGSKRILLKK